MWRQLGNAILVFLISATPLLADDNAGARDGKRILTQSREAIRNARMLRYEGDYRVTGYIKQWVQDIQGTAIVGQISKHDVPRFRIELEQKEEDSEEAVRYVVGSDGDKYFLVDEKAKTVYADMDPAVLGSNSRAFRRVLLPELSEKEPFQEALESETISVGDSESVAGEDCHVVVIKNESPPDVMWWISKKDQLPRRVRRLYKNAEGEEGTTELTLRALEVNPRLRENPFLIPEPEGFKRTDDFAP